nr:hypothetical protein [Tanacetum cinerariifolium]
ESKLLESLLNRDTLIDSSPNFDYLLKEFSGDLAHIDPILPGIEEADFDLEEEIHLVENFSYDNLFHRPPKELNAEITDTIFESLSPYPIPVKDKLLINDALPLPGNKLSNIHHHDDPSFPRPHPKPPDVEVFFDFELDTGVLTTKVLSSISNTPQISLVSAIAPTLPTEEPNYSLSIGDEHLSNIPETESDEEIKSSVKNLVPILSESEVTSDNESECDVPVNDESSPIFTTFSNP